MRKDTGNGEQSIMVSASGRHVSGVAGEFTCPESQPLADMHVITEISDKDYRSWALPCNALEESGDCNREQ